MRRATCYKLWRCTLAHCSLCTTAAEEAGTLNCNNRPYQPKLRFGLCTVLTAVSIHNSLVHPFCCAVVTCTELATPTQHLAQLRRTLFPVCLCHWLAGSEPMEYASHGTTHCDCNMGDCNQPGLAHKLYHTVRKFLRTTSTAALACNPLPNEACCTAVSRTVHHTTLYRNTCTARTVRAA